MQTKYDYKDSLLASLYSQVEFLRGEIEEKNLLIRTLILREGDVSRNRYTDDQINLLRMSRVRTLAVEKHLTSLSRHQQVKLMKRKIYMKILMCYMLNLKNLKKRR